jgi:tetratricopeptide (TPR) repeat protein
MKRWIAPLVLAVLCANLRGNAQKASASPAQLAQSHITRAKQLLAEHDFERGKSEIDEAIKIDPNSSEAYQLLGQISLQNGRVPEAVSAFERALKLKPDSFSAHYGLGMARLREQNIEAGIRELRTAVSLRPSDIDANYNLGVLLLDQGRPAAAITHLQKARALGGERADVAYNLIRAELACGKPDEAREVGMKAATSLGRDSTWLAAVGRLFLESHRLEDGIAYLERALILSPGAVETKRRLAAAYLETNQPGQVLSLINSPQSAEDYYLQASANYLLRQYDPATHDAESAVRMDPGNPQYMLLAARIDQHLGRNESALSMLEQAIKAAPKWAELYYSAGVSLYCEKRYAEAGKYLRKSLTLQPDFPRALFLYSVSLVSEGNNEEGEEHLQKAIALDPGNVHFRYYLGEILIRENKLQDAEEAYRQAIRIDPKYAPLHYQLGKILLRFNHPDLAAKETEEAIRYDPGLAEAYYQLIQAYNKLGEKEKSSRAASIFATLKKRDAGDKDQFYNNVKKELGLP